MANFGIPAQPMMQALRAGERFVSYEKRDLVTLVVVADGVRTIELAAHVAQLYKSPFFRTALQGKWLEGQTNKIELLDDDQRPVEHYLDFLYSGQVSDELRVEDLAQLYVFGQKMLDPAYKNAVLARMLHEPKQWENDALFHFYDKDVVSIMYEGTRSGSLGRKMLVDIFHAVGSAEWLALEFPTEFQRDLLAKFMGCRNRPKLCDLALSTYMEEVPEEEEEEEEEERP